ncbi:hypothetical protein [Streptococcus sp. Marseille-Q3533]|uniref:hypothetical protein n=1 Tax=Streptococcus sp. Marseille-Q3533 TaxID=2759692 RepID=UPI002024FCAD|nr:hypothetical protein [Streptococcus sp. Marseille-Q3533]
MNTYKVIKIEGTLIYLGKDDGTLLKVEQTSFNFVPQLGDIVEAYKSEETYIIAKKSSEVPTEKKEKGPLTIKNIKVMAWLGIVLTLLRDPLFFAIPVMMGHLLKEKGEKDSGNFMLGVSIFAGITALITRFILTGRFS